MTVSRSFVGNLAALWIAATALVVVAPRPAAAFPPGPSIGLPAAAESPAGVTATTLTEGPAAALPTGPALLGVVRVTYAPGAGESMAFGAFGDVAYVEEGELTLRIDGDARVTRPSAGGAVGLVQRPAAGEEFVVDRGDAIYLPGGAGEIRNAGDAPAVLLVGFVGAMDGDPNAGPPAAPAGIEQALLGVGMTTDLSAAPGGLMLERVTFAPRATLTVDAEDPSVRLIVAEEGAVRLRYDALLTVGRGAPGDGEQIAAGTEVTLSPGESALVPAFARGEVGSAGEDPAAVLVMRVRPPVAVSAPA